MKSNLTYPNLTYHGLTWPHVTSPSPLSATSLRPLLGQSASKPATRLPDVIMHSRSSSRLRNCPGSQSVCPAYTVCGIISPRSLSCLAASLICILNKNAEDLKWWVLDKTCSRCACVQPVCRSTQNKDAGIYLEWFRMITYFQSESSRHTGCTCIACLFWPREAAAVSLSLYTIWM